MTVRKACLTLMVCLLSNVPWSAACAEALLPAEESRYVPEVSALVYQPARYTDQAVDLSWDFSADKIYAYAFEQTTYATTDFGMRPGKGGPDQNYNAVSADVLVKSLGNNVARIVYQDIVATMEVQTPDGPEKMSQKHPAKVVGEMSEKSRDPDSRDPGREAPEDLFPLPALPLKVGETSSYPVKVPFNAMGSLLYVTGEERITLTGFVTRDGVLCAQLDIVQDVRELEIPPEVEGDYYFSQDIRGRAFFDVTGRRFVEVVMAARNIMKVLSDSPEVSFGPGSDMDDKLPKEVGMSMDSDSLIRLVAK